MNDRGWKNTDKGELYSVILNINHPLLVTDQEASDKATLLNAISKYPQVNKIQARKDIVSVLETAGYDGLVYKNNFEDVGKMSYVIFHPEQVKILDNRIRTDELFTPSENNIKEIQNNEEYDAICKSFDFVSMDPCYHFNVNGSNYIVYFEGKDGIFSCGFFYIDKDGIGNHSLQNNGNQFGVFKNVISCILMFIEKYYPNKLSFDGYTSRQSAMYKKCFKHYGSKLLPEEYDYHETIFGVTIVKNWYVEDEEDDY
jgi:hypothetical protein